MSRELIYLKRRIKKIISVIEALDSFRSGYFTDIDRLILTYRELELGGRARKWKEVRRDLERLVLGSAKIRETRKYLKYEKIMGKIYKVVLALLIISMLSSLLGIPTLTMALILPLLIIFPVVLFTRLFIREKIRIIYINNSERFRDEINRIKKDIDILIQEVMRISKRAGLDSRTISMNLINADYSNIKVVKKPGRFSRYYTVVPKIEGE